MHLFITVILTACLARAALGQQQYCCPTTNNYLNSADVLLGQIVVNTAGGSNGSGTGCACSVLLPAIQQEMTAIVNSIVQALWTNDLGPLNKSTAILLEALLDSAIGGPVGSPTPYGSNVWLYALSGTSNASLTEVDAIGTGVAGLTTINTAISNYLQTLLAYSFAGAGDGQSAASWLYALSHVENVTLIPLLEAIATDLSPVGNPTPQTLPTWAMAMSGQLNATATLVSAISLNVAKMYQYYFAGLTPATGESAASLLWGISNTINVTTDPTLALIKAGIDTTNTLIGDLISGSSFPVGDGGGSTRQGTTAVTVANMVTTGLLYAVDDPTQVQSVWYASTKLGSGTPNIQKFYNVKLGTAVSSFGWGLQAFKTTPSVSTSLGIYTSSTPLASAPFSTPLLVPDSVDWPETTTFLLLTWTDAPGVTATIENRLQIGEGRWDGAPTSTLCNTLETEYLFYFSFTIPSNFTIVDSSQHWLEFATLGFVDVAAVGGLPLTTFKSLIASWSYYVSAGQTGIQGVFGNQTITSFPAASFGDYFSICLPPGMMTMRGLMQAMANYQGTDDVSDFLTNYAWGDAVGAYPPGYFPPPYQPYVSSLSSGLRNNDLQFPPVTAETEYGAETTFYLCVVGQPEPIYMGSVQSFGGAVSARTFVSGKTGYTTFTTEWFRTAPIPMAIFDMQTNLLASGLSLPASGDPGNLFIAFEWDAGYCSSSATFIPQALLALSLDFEYT